MTYHRLQCEIFGHFGWLYNEHEAGHRSLYIFVRGEYKACTPSIHGQSNELQKLRRRKKEESGSDEANSAVVQRMKCCLNCLKP